MDCPATASEAADFIEKLAKEEGITVNAYCLARSVDPSVIHNWRFKNKSYQIDTFARLIKKI